MRHWNFSAILLAGFALWAGGQGTTRPRGQDRAPSAEERSALLSRVIADQHANDAALDLYERIERRETRKTARESEPAQVQVFRVVPARTGSGRIPVGAHGQPAGPPAHTAPPRQIHNALVLASEPHNPGEP